MTLIDTSAWVEALRKEGRPEFRDQVRKLMLDRGAALCELVLLELWNGARGDAERKALAAIERQVKLLPLTNGVWNLAFQLARDCRDRGLTVPATDVAIAACARFYEAELLHNDSHLAMMLATSL